MDIYTQPLAPLECHLKYVTKSSRNNWYPVEGLADDTRDAAALTKGIQVLVKQIREQLGVNELERRVYAPQHEVPYLEKTNSPTTTCTVVARMPRELFNEVSQKHFLRQETESFSKKTKGWMLKRGELMNKGYKRRWMELSGNLLTYYKRKPNTDTSKIQFSRWSTDRQSLVRGVIDLDHVYTLQPCSHASDNFAIDLVTPTRTWVLAAETENELEMWLRAFCEVVKFEAIHSEFKQKLQLEEVRITSSRVIKTTLASTATVDEAIQQLFQNYETKYPLCLRDYNPKDYSLKVTAFSDYLIGKDIKLQSFQYVQDCMSTKKTIRFTLVHNDLILDAQKRRHEFRTCKEEYETSDDDTIAATISTPTPLNPTTTTTTTTTPTIALTENNTTLQKSKLVPSKAVRLPLRMRLLHLDDIPTMMYTAHQEENGKSWVEVSLNITEIRIRTEFYHRGEFIPGTHFETASLAVQETENKNQYVDFRDILSWEETGIYVSEIPYATRVVFTILGYCSLSKKTEVLGSCGIQLFAIDSTLISGTFKLNIGNTNLFDCRSTPLASTTPLTDSEFEANLLASKKSDWIPPEQNYHPSIFSSFMGDNKVSPTHKKCINFEMSTVLYVQFNDFSSHVVFDFLGNSSVLDDLRLSSLIDIQIEKQGWLEKLGLFQTFSKWRRRWFVLSQRDCVLEYYKSCNECHVAKGKILLDGAKIAVADELNKKFTTFGINKGTRKERQTWCFKIIPKGKNREYAIAASTEQERQEWINALVHVADGEQNDDENFSSISSPSSLTSNTTSFNTTSFNTTSFNTTTPSTTTPTTTPLTTTPPITITTPSTISSITPPTTWSTTAPITTTSDLSDSNDSQQKNTGDFTVDSSFSSTTSLHKDDKVVMHEVSTTILSEKEKNGLMTWQDSPEQKKKVLVKNIAIRDINQGIVVDEDSTILSTNNEKELALSTDKEEELALSTNKEEEVIISRNTNKEEEIIISRNTNNKEEETIISRNTNNKEEEIIISRNTNNKEEEVMLENLSFSKNETRRFHRTSRSSQSRSRTSTVSQSSEEIEEILEKLFKKDVLYCLNSKEKSLLWNFRDQYKCIPEALPKFLLCIDWTNPHHYAEVTRLLTEWAPQKRPEDVLQLFDEVYCDPIIRNFAIKHIEKMPNAQLQRFLPQLVQSLKFELHHSSPLAFFLIQRAIECPSRIGLDLFWYLNVEAGYVEYKERYGLILNAYLDSCGRRQRSVLKLQHKLWSSTGVFVDICTQVKAYKKSGLSAMKGVLHERLHEFNNELTGTFQLPIDPRIEVGKVVVKKCKVMDSAKNPLWLVFANAEEGGEPITIIFKTGDDIRQDCVTLQLIRIMDEICRDEGVELSMEPYHCISTSHNTGLVQVVQNSVTTADIHKRYGGKLGAYKSSTFINWIRDNNPDEYHFEKATDLFLRSCAGYCVATYILGVGDRHNDNIMINARGRYFHIDFGHFLGNYKYQFGIKRERAAIVFTKEMAYVMGGKCTPKFDKFIQLAGNAYNIIRSARDLLSTLLILMIPGKMPELQSRDDIQYLLQRLGQDATPEEASKQLEAEIYHALESKSRPFDNTIHILAHSL